MDIYSTHKCSAFSILTELITDRGAFQAVLRSFRMLCSWLKSVNTKHTGLS